MSHRVIVILWATLVTLGLCTVWGCGEAAPPPSVRSPAAPAAAPGLPATPPATVAQAAPAEATPTEAAATAPAPEPFHHPRQTFEAVRELLTRSYYREGLTEEDLYRAATRGMIEHLDPSMQRWNRLLGPRELEQLKSDLKGEIVGVGIDMHFDPETGHAEVRTVLPGTPADKGGLLRGDRIVNVNGQRFKGRSRNDLVRALRGPAGEVVRLTVLRGDELVRFELARAPVAYTPVSHLALPDGVGYIQIQGFSQKTAPALGAALDELERLKVRALVIDLRTNQGGAFDEAIATASLLLPRGTGIVRLRKRGQADELLASQGPGRLPALPMAVLIERRTSSGAEFLAAALKEGRGATLVGHPTLGKWSVQKLAELENGHAVKYTIGLFETPAGQRYDGSGLPADVEVTMEPRQIDRAQGVHEAAERLAQDAQLRTALRLLAAR